MIPDVKYNAKIAMIECHKHLLQKNNDALVT